MVMLLEGNVGVTELSLSHEWLLRLLHVRHEIDPVGKQMILVIALTAFTLGAYV